jgi:chemotaxis protein methyltransferase CheR
MDISTQGLSAEQLTELIAIVKTTHGFDFSGYTKASLKRRLSRIMMLKKLDFPELMVKLADDNIFFRGFLEEITVNVTEMFRDPSFYKALQTNVLPVLNITDQVKIWSAGCASGEEVYSLSILTDAAGLNEKTSIWGTDINTIVLNTAKEGVYPFRSIKNYADNYLQTGLTGLITDYFTISNDTASIYPNLKTNTSFSVHDLVSGQVFDQFHLISCRNVFIYFETALQEKILDLFYNSLHPGGFLCLGSKETIRSDKFKNKFRVINQNENIYQKIAA